MAIAVLRAETFYLPPSDQPANAWALMPAAERVFRWVELRQQRRLVPPEGFMLGHRLYAQINHNRWVGECPCGSAQVVSPADPRMACTECGAGWFVLVFPDDPAAAEAEVAHLMPHDRNWWNPEDESAWNRPPDTAADPLGDLLAEPDTADDEDEEEGW
ncbi:hypothetical protein ACFUIY_37665 [Streptomyces griseorubiginosus]|uniref:hypothetical protein n=1 Tax=Streptomyces griseorubiginosus TaxID=67304 RepID=UPI0036415EC1